MLYRACAPLLTATEVDHMELWQVAVHLGVDQQTAALSAPSPAMTLPRGRVRSASGATTIRGVVLGGAPRNNPVNG